MLRILARLLPSMSMWEGRPEPKACPGRALEIARRRKLCTICTRYGKRSTPEAPDRGWAARELQRNRLDYGRKSTGLERMPER